MFVELAHFPGPGPVVLGELTGRAEIAVSGQGAIDAIHLLDAVLLAHPAAVVVPGDAARISVSDRDRVLVQLHVATFGSRIAGDSRCRKCDARFDFDFDLDELVSRLSPDQPHPAASDGWIDGADGSRFRLPTGEDELAAAGLGAEAASNVIALRCLPEGAPPDEAARVEERVQALAPLVDMTLDACCPECRTANPLAFSIERYFLSSIRAERRHLLREIHQIASAYSWSYDAIVDLARPHRRELVAQIERDEERGRRTGGR